MSMERLGPSSSRYVDYTQPGPSGYRAPPSVSSYEYSPPQRPPRRDRSRSRSRDREHSSRSGYSSREVYYNPGLEDDRAPSDRAESEFTVRNEAVINPQLEEERRAASRAASEIYASTRLPRPQSEISSQYTYPTSDKVSVKTKTTRGGKLVMETMTAPHPCCPNTRSVCCLMVLLNLGLLLITLGFVVVLQLYNPAFVWYIGLCMLIFGFMVLFGSLIYCVFVCREVEKMRPPPGELYWTNHWTKTLNMPEIHYTNTQYKPSDYKGSEYSFKTDPSRTTATNSQRY
ncbi:uncharacterized protein LOC123516568 isoform X2 [Portunus trituberculatus]|uniref:uncharacterized protein LOC123516568 isoform X2 n=1 Tax=Portunus trituberculatus TaxID=210409 RepID=UPI001E1CB958|nr:uncharacterized protein LOC123516568 isoform X2 [Portunus trituberculatus]